MDVTASAVIHLKNCDHPSDICRVLKHLDIRSYAYNFWTWEGIIKNGESCDNSATYGERIYRQAWWLPGWSERPCSSNGAEMMLIAEDFEKVHKRVLHKNSVFIMIYDTTSSTDPKNQGLAIERYFIDEHINHTGKAPLGNKDPKTKLTETQIRNQRAIDKFFVCDHE
jgi:hypothetical protein